MKMRVLQTLLILCVLSIDKIKCEEIFEYHPCIGVEKIIETFNTSDPFAYNVTILFSKFDLLPEKVNLELKFDALSNITYNFSPYISYTDGYLIETFTVMKIKNDLSFRIAPYTGSEKVPNLISLQINDEEFCKNGVEKDMWINFVELTKLPVRIPPSISFDGASSTNKECGRRRLQLTPFIIHGYKSKPGDWPWHAAIYRLNTKNSQLTYTCGGSLVSKTRVITAGHCVVEFGSVIAPERLYVAFGKFNFIGDDNGLQEKRVFEIILHPEYSRINLTNDIAILKLSSEVTFSDYVQPVCINDISYPSKTEIVGRMGYVAGWGRDERGKHSKQLSESRMPIKSDLECYQKDPSFFGIFLNDGNFCVGYDNGTNVCNGDSGGGLFLPYNTTDGQQIWFLRGIVSLGAANHDRKICDPYHYTIFTDITKYMDFIKINI